MDVVGIGVTDVADADVDVVEVGVAGKDVELTVFRTVT